MAPILLVKAARQCAISFPVEPTTPLASAHIGCPPPLYPSIARVWKVAASESSHLAITSGTSLRRVITR
jgi:hypothetical protein